MNTATAYAKLRSLGLPVVRTSEAAAVLGISPLNAAQILRRLGKIGLVQPLRHGLAWLKDGPIDPWVALDYLSAPYPSYASLYSALFLHGVLSQLPVIHYAVSLGRTARIATLAGTFSLHRVVPELFGGYQSLPSGGKLATVEKALFDLAYLSSVRSRLFARPPELELPRHLDVKELERWIARIKDERRQVQVGRQLDRLLSQ